MSNRATTALPLARRSIADDAAAAASTQPSKAATTTGSVSDGRSFSSSYSGTRWRIRQSRPPDRSGSAGGRLRLVVAPPAAVRAHLVPVAADLHRAPGAAVTLRGVVEGPAAGGVGAGLEAHPAAIVDGVGEDREQAPERA